MTIWQRAIVAPDRSHHRLDGAPLYAERFDEVLDFRAPGLAPARCGDSAWHIAIDGRAAYAPRFLRTFGFYEARAAVVSPDGWHHIDGAGADVYSDRYDWCGNFQGGRCTVRSTDRKYLHIDPRGVPAYAARWHYAGDYREGFAVVQAPDGRSTHVDVEGSLIHGQWFLDLDAPHKGFARARDHDGWFHVDRHGRAVYAARFAMAESFYNGQARVETTDGALLVINEKGEPLVSLRVR